MLKIIKEVKTPELLVVTPLFKGHRLSRETKLGLERNDIKFAWVSFESTNNTAKNYADGIKAFRDKVYRPKYVMMVDKDIIPARHMLDKMYDTLKRTPNDIAFCYVSFEFVGAINRQFFGIEYNPIALLRSNYISSNSMIKLDKLDEIGGVVTDNKYKRLLDWCLWLNFLSYGYYGIRCPDTGFVAISDKESISARSNEDYKQKSKLVMRDFIDPLVDGVII
jgi:hypothetical protein